MSRKIIGIILILLGIAIGSFGVWLIVMAPSAFWGCLSVVGLGVGLFFWDLIRIEVKIFGKI